MIKGKVAIITGAGGGVGKAISKRLSSEGCKVVMIGRDRSKLQKAAAEIGNKKSTMTVIADITKEAEVLSAIDQTINSFDKIDRSEEHTFELQSRQYLVCRLLL